MTARALGASDDRTTDRILRASFWSDARPSEQARVIELSAIRATR